MTGHLPFSAVLGAPVSLTKRVVNPNNPMTRRPNNPPIWYTYNRIFEPKDPRFMPTVTIEIGVPPEIRKIWDERGGPIVKYPDPVLTQPAKPVTRHPREMRELVDRMKEAMHNFSGVGLAA